MLGLWELPETLQQLAEAGDEEFVNELLETFRTDTAVRLGLLRGALEAADRARVRAHAHSVRGSAIQVGATSLAAVCLTLELNAPTADLADLATAVSQAESEFEVLHSSRSVND